MATSSSLSIPISSFRKFPPTPFLSPQITSLLPSSPIPPLLQSVSTTTTTRALRSLSSSALAAASDDVAVVEEKKKVLIVNTNSGGHAVIGFYLAKELISSGHEVTVFTVGDETSDKMNKAPFTNFPELVKAGGQTVWGDPLKLGESMIGATFDVVLENNGKELDTVRPVVDWAKSIGAKQFLYISSAGIYKTDYELPHVEGDVVKGDASHVAAENYIQEAGFSSCAIFRPQYMIGSGNNKDCEEWFFDRIVRGRPILLPTPGVQLTNISHVRDLSSMLALAIEKPSAANGNVFNCVSERAVTFNGLAKLCAQAAGQQAQIVHYDPKACGVDAKKSFPFRNMHFYAEPRAARQILGWKSSTNLAEDLKDRFEEYVKIGRDKKEMKFEIDDKILASLTVAAQ